jgi:hypothetical protein
MEILTSRAANDVISAVPLGNGTKSRSYRQDRVCGAAGCSTVLSVYNASVLCSVHERRYPGSSIAPRATDPGHPVYRTEEKS